MRISGGRAPKPVFMASPPGDSEAWPYLRNTRLGVGKLSPEDYIPPEAC